MTEPIYAIGDIHGQIDDLHRVLNLIEEDGGPDAQIVFLGDYVDRGPDSKGVVQFLSDGLSAGRNWVCVKGNHDRYLTRFLDDKAVYDKNTRTGLTWFNPILGGDKTLASYGVLAHEDAPLGPIFDAAKNAVPEQHAKFLSDLPLYHETADKIFVHAGVRPGIPMPEQVEDDLIWIRAGFLDHVGSFGKLVVHGHTALEHPQHVGNRVNLDAGAGYFRPLHTAVFEGTDCWLLSEVGRIPLQPA